MGDEETEAFLQNLCELLEHFMYEKARDLLDRERDACRTQSGWAKLVGVCTQLLLAEKQYSSLALFAHKSFLRKDTSARTCFDAIHDDCCRLLRQHQQHTPLHAAFGQLVELAAVRLRLIDAYERLSQYGAQSLPADATLPASVAQQITCLDCLSRSCSDNNAGGAAPLWRLLSREAAGLHALCGAHEQLLRARFTDCLWQLDAADSQLQLLEASVQLSRRPAEPRRLLFLRVQQQPPPPALIVWLRRLHTALIEAFSLCWRPVLRRQLDNMPSSSPPPHLAAGPALSGCHSACVDSAAASVVVESSSTAEITSSAAAAAAVSYSASQELLEPPATLDVLYDKLVGCRRRHDLWLAAVVAHDVRRRCLHAADSHCHDQEQDDAACEEAAMTTGAAAAVARVYVSQGYRCPCSMRRQPHGDSPECGGGSGGGPSAVDCDGDVSGGSCRLLVGVARTEGVAGGGGGGAAAADVVDESDALRRMVARHWCQLSCQLEDMRRQASGGGLVTYRHCSVPCDRCYFQMPVGGRLAVVFVADGCRGENDAAIHSALYDVAAMVCCVRTFQQLPTALK